MDNKKWYKKYMTLFWCTITILPFVFVLIYFISFHFGLNGGFTEALELETYQTSSYGSISYIFDEVANIFDSYTPQFITNIFSTIWTNTFSVSNTSMAIFISFMLWVQLVHLIFDFLVFFIHLVHSFLDTERFRFF